MSAYTSTMDPSWPNVSPSSWQSEGFMDPRDLHSTLDHHDWCLNHLKSSLNHYVWCLHHHFSYFSWPITTFWICKSRCFRLRIPGFGAETKTRRSRPAFPAGLGDSLCYLPHPAGPLEPRPGSLQCLFQWIGLRENLQESPIFNGKIYGFL